MADATTTISRDFKEPMGTYSFKIKNTEVMVVGGAAAVALTTGLTENADDTAGLIPAGIVVSAEDGGSSLTGTNLATEADKGAVCRGGIIIKDVTVTGVSSYADIGAFVYATDNQTFTLTRPADDALPYGIIVDKSRASTNTTCDVYFFSFVESAMMSAAGGGTKSCISLGYVDAGGLMDDTDNAVILDVQLFGHGKITKIYAVSQGYSTDWATGTTVTDFTIAGGTAINDGAASPTTITLTLLETSIDAAADRGTTIDTSDTIGGDNEFHDGDNLVMAQVNAGTTAFTKTGGTADSGGWNIYAEIEWLPGS